MSENLWQECLIYLAKEVPEDQVATWIKPLHVEVESRHLAIFAPNRFVLQWVKDKFSSQILNFAKDFTSGRISQLTFAVGSKQEVSSKPTETASSLSKSVVKNKPVKPEFKNLTAPTQTLSVQEPAAEGSQFRTSPLNPLHTFSNLVEGKSNQLAKAASLQVAQNPGHSYNPLFIYGGVGLGKTHLMHAIGNKILKNNSAAKVAYINSERFVQDMVKALRLNTINDFKRYYRSLDVLLIDDIQFFVGKDRSQEEFFHTFNALLEGGQQIILTSDRYPKEISVEERLKSRFGWGLSIAIEPPELEMRVAILIKKAELSNFYLPQDVAFFMAKRIRSHVRDLEGALNRVNADAKFQGKPITISLVQESLKDLFAVQARQVSIENIQRIVAEHYKIKLADLLSKRRTRSIARPRQIAMALSKELTSHSLPEIGDAFGGRDHTTVLHACRKVVDLQKESAEISEDWKILMRLLTS